MNPNFAAIALAIGVLAPHLLAAGVRGQSTGGQRGTGNPMTNAATPMQQQPSGTNPGTAATQMSPQQFALTVGSANKFEVIEGELALAQANDPKLKDFARMMVEGPRRRAAGTAGSRQGRQRRPAVGHRAGRNAPGQD
jgi:hypothetical protein